MVNLHKSYMVSEQSDSWILSVVVFGATMDHHVDISLYYFLGGFACVV